MKLTQIGRVVERYLLSSQNIPGVKIDQFVIMPDHIHAIICISSEKITGQKDGTSRAPSPTNEMLPHIISTFKRLCNKAIGENVFQRSYSDHVIRDREDYETRRRYIYENPLRWIIKNKTNSL
ncbi:MAG: transposase [Clostridia bacterium]|nr:transposase [Clostridia bacterium]